MTKYSLPTGLTADTQTWLNFTTGTSPGGYSQPLLEIKKYWLLHSLLELQSVVIRVVVGSRLAKKNHPCSYTFGQ